MQCASARHFVFSGFEFVLLSEDAYSVRWLVCFSGFLFHVPRGDMRSMV